MILALLLMQATAVDAELAAAQDAATLGQWTASRRWAADDAVMFAPEPVRAQRWLKDRADPPASMDWKPTGSWTSCDGSVAVTTGYWHGAANGVGWFTTVWRRQADSRWKWVLSHGDTLDRATLGNRRFENQVPDCRRRPPKLPPAVVHGNERPGGFGQSSDATLRYSWTAEPKFDGGIATWSRDIVIELWNGKDWKRVLNEWSTAAE